MAYAGSMGMDQPSVELFNTQVFRRRHRTNFAVLTYLEATRALAVPQTIALKFEHRGKIALHCSGCLRRFA